MPSDYRGRDWGYAPQAKEYLGLPEAGRSKERSSAKDFGESMAL